MIPALSSGLSALNAFSQGMNTTANNVANVQSDGFSAAQAVFKEAAAGAGVSVSSAATGEGTDLTKAVVDSMVYRIDLEMTAKMIKTTEKMLGQLIDIKA